MRALLEQGVSEATLRLATKTYAAAEKRAESNPRRRFGPPTFFKDGEWKKFEHGPPKRPAAKASSMTDADIRRELTPTQEQRAGGHLWIYRDAANKGANLEPLTDAFDALFEAEYASRPGDTEEAKERRAAEVKARRDEQVKNAARFSNAARVERRQPTPEEIERAKPKDAAFIKAVRDGANSYDAIAQAAAFDPQDGP